jgi:hypothetical protein
MSDVNITSYNQSGGITAQNVNLGIVPRRLDDNGRSQIRSLIPKSKKVVVSAALGDGEACQLAAEVFAFMKADGWDVEGVNQSIWMPPIRGQQINNQVDPWQMNIGHHPG